MRTIAEVIKSIEQIEDLFRLVVLRILKLDPGAPENHSRVRFPWGSNLKAGVGSAPAWDKDADVCVIYALPQDDPLNRHRDRKYKDYGGRDLVAVDEHTDTHHFNFVNYGSNAYECARDIRDGLFLEDIRLTLQYNHFALVPDASAIKRVPELYEGQWWNRVDFQAVFNEYVRRESRMNAIEEIKVTAMRAMPDGSLDTASAVVSTTNA